MKENSQEKLVSLSALVTTDQREWLDAEVLRRSAPGAMESISGVIRLVIEAYRGQQRRDPKDRERASVDSDMMGDTRRKDDTE